MASQLSELIQLPEWAYELPVKCKMCGKRFWGGHELAD